METFFETKAEAEEREATIAGAWVVELDPREEPAPESHCCPDAWTAARRLCGCW